MRRQGTAQQCSMRRLTQVRGAGDSRGAVFRYVLQTVKLHRVGQPRRGGRHQGYRARCAARVLTADHSIFGQHSQALAVRLAGALGLLDGRVCRLLLRTLPKLGVEPQLAGGGCGQISEGEGKVHGDFSAGGERNKAGVKPCRRERARVPVEESGGTPRHPHPERLIFGFHVKHYRKST